MGPHSHKRLSVHSVFPVTAGAISRGVIIKKKGEEFFKDKFNPAVGKISIVALLLTLIVLFSFEGQTILNDPLLVGYLALPNLIHYAIMIAWTYPLGLLLRLEIRERNRHHNNWEQ